jgi:PKHD-type hydroxylase
MWIIDPPNRNNDTWYFKIDNVFEDELLNLIDEYVKEHEDYILPAPTASSNLNSQNVRRSDVLFLADHKKLEKVYTRITDLVTEANDYYRYALAFLENLQYSIYKSDINGFYTTHTDSGLKGKGGMCRKLSFSILLNDSFEGGDLIMNNFAAGHNVEIQKNQIVFFPSFMPHSVTPVTSGIRKSLVGWVQGPNFV